MRKFHNGGQDNWNRNYYEDSSMRLRRVRNQASQEADKDYPWWLFIVIVIAFFVWQFTR